MPRAKKVPSPFADGRGSGQSQAIQEFDAGQKTAGKRPGSELKIATPPVTENISLLDALKIQKSDGVSLRTRAAIKAIDDEVMGRNSQLTIKRGR